MPCQASLFDMIPARAKCRWLILAHSMRLPCPSTLPIVCLRISSTTLRYRFVFQGEDGIKLAGQLKEPTHLGMRKAKLLRRMQDSIEPGFALGAGGVGASFSGCCTFLAWSSSTQGLQRIRILDVSMWHALWSRVCIRDSWALQLPDYPHMAILYIPQPGKYTPSLARAIPMPPST